jgi:hypothetical protein
VESADLSHAPPTIDDLRFTVHGCIFRPGRRTVGSCGAFGKRPPRS